MFHKHLGESSILSGGTTINRSVLDWLLWGRSCSRQQSLSEESKGVRQMAVSRMRKEVAYRFRVCYTQYSGIAQLVEREAVNFLVGGSSPSPRAR